eukprot:427234-Karenia_brevis.AAC.1
MCIRDSVLAKVPLCGINEPAGPDVDLVERSHRAYQKAGLEISPGKSFGGSCSCFYPDTGQSPTIVPGNQHFIAWGTEVDSKTGFVGTPESKRAQLCA